MPMVAHLLGLDSFDDAPGGDEQLHMEVGLLCSYLMLLPALSACEVARRT